MISGVLEPVESGDIFIPKGEKDRRGVARVVVYRVAKHGSIFYDGLANHPGSGAVCHGHASQARFLEDWQLVSRMTFAGAYQMYRHEKSRANKAKWWLRHISDLAGRV